MDRFMRPFPGKTYRAPKMFGILENVMNLGRYLLNTQSQNSGDSEEGKYGGEKKQGRNKNFLLP
jgi:hypothetical protein